MKEKLLIFIKATFKFGYYIWYLMKSYFCCFIFSIIYVCIASNYHPIYSVKGIQDIFRGDVSWISEFECPLMALCCLFTYIFFIKVRLQPIGIIFHNLLFYAIYSLCKSCIAFVDCSMICHDKTVYGLILYLCYGCICSILAFLLIVYIKKISRNLCKGCIMLKLYKLQLEWKGNRGKKMSFLKYIIKAYGVCIITIVSEIYLGSSIFYLFFANTNDITSFDSPYLLGLYVGLVFPIFSFLTYVVLFRVRLNVVDIMIHNTFYLISCCSEKGIDALAKYLNLYSYLTEYSLTYFFTYNFLFSLITCLLIVHAKKYQEQPIV